MNQTQPVYRCIRCNQDVERTDNTGSEPRFAWHLCATCMQELRAIADEENR